MNDIIQKDLPPNFLLRGCEQCNEPIDNEFDSLVAFPFDGVPVRLHTECIYFLSTGLKAKRGFVWYIIGSKVVKGTFEHG